MVQVQELWKNVSPDILLAFLRKRDFLGRTSKKKGNHHRTTKVKRMLNSDFREMQPSASLAFYQLELRQETTVQTHSGPCMHIPFQVDPEGRCFSINPATLLGWVVKSDVLSGVHSMNSQSNVLHDLIWNFTSNTSNFEEFPPISAWFGALPKQFNIITNESILSPLFQDFGNPKRMVFTMLSPGRCTPVSF